jgi:hypothetical protein
MLPERHDWSSGLLEPCSKPTLLGWRGVHTHTHTDLQRKRVRRYRDRARRFHASGAKTKKRTDRPAFIQLAQLRDILADGIEAQLRADVVHSSN